MVNYRLVNIIRKSNEQHEQDIKDLFEAIVISNMVSIAGGGTEDLIKKFTELYKGKRIIFK